MVLRLWFSFHTEMGIGGGYQVPEFPESGCGQNISRYLKRAIGSPGVNKVRKKTGKGRQRDGEGTACPEGWSLVGVLFPVGLRPLSGYQEG